MGIGSLPIYHALLILIFLDKNNCQEVVTPRNIPIPRLTGYRRLTGYQYNTEKLTMKGQDFLVVLDRNST